MSEELKEPGIVARAVNSVEAAIAKLAATKQAEAKQAQATEEAQRIEYRQIICRSENPKASDAARLEELIVALKLDTAGVKGDAAFVAEIRQHVTLARRREDLAEGAAAAFRELAAVKERHKAELKAAEANASSARYQATRAYDAATAVCKGWNERPEWFGTHCLEWPANVTKPDSSQSEAKPVRMCAKVEIDMGDGFFVEPVVGPNGQYIRDGRGKYLLPSGQYTP